MNTAISICCRINEEFLDEYPQFKDHGAITHFLYDGYLDPNSKDEKGFATYTSPNFKISSKIFFYDNMYVTLRFFFMAGKLPFYQDGYRS